MKTSERRRVRSRKLDRFRPPSCEDQQSSQSKWTNTPARGTTQSGTMTNIWTLRYHHERLNTLRVWALHRHRNNLSTCCSLQSNNQSVNCACVLQSPFYLAVFESWTPFSNTCTVCFQMSFFFFSINSPRVLRWAARPQMFVFQSRFFSFF